MKFNRFLLWFALGTAFTFFTISECRADVINFDDLNEMGTGSFIPNGYQDLDWFNFRAINSVSSPSIFGTNGFNYGMISASNVAFNNFGKSAEINSAGTNFNLLSAYLTGVFNSNLNIEVQGFRDGNLLYNQTVVASATNPTPFTFNYLNVDRVIFNAFGGQAAFDETPDPVFAMDNLTFELVPEPSSLLLATAGALALCTLLKRKHPLDETDVA